MRERMSSGNHPMQPLSPKHQPWFKKQAPDRCMASVAMSKSGAGSKDIGSAAGSVEQEILLRARIEQRTAEKLEKLHDAVEHDRFVRRIQRQRSSGNVVEMLKREKSKSDAEGVKRD